MIASATISDGGVYAVAFRPDGTVVAAAGGDGIVRLINTETGRITKEFSPGALAEPSTAAAGPAPRRTIVAGVWETSAAPGSASASESEAEALPKGSVVERLEVEPASIALNGPFEVVQMVVTATINTGDRIDVTRLVTPRLSADIAEVSRSGMVRPLADGEAVATLTLNLAGTSRTIEVPVKVSGVNRESHVSFVHDVVPVMSRLGCNQGTCHGSAQGKNGFKLSLRGYDPLFDVRAPD